jgi:hypothetical protein
MENGGVASGAAVIWNLNTGALAVSGVVGAGYTLQSQGIENYGNGWYRCRITVLLGLGAAGNIRANTSDGTMSAAIINSASGNTAYVWGAQIETGSIATSYIPTTAAAVTRNADVITLSGAVSGCIGQTEGTIYAEVDIRSFANDGRIVAISDGTLDNRFSLLTKGGNIIRAEVSAAGSGQVLINTAALTSGVHKIALAYKQDDFAFYVDGTQIGTDTNGTVPACSQIFLGKRETTTLADFLNNRIRSAALYTTRLTNAELAALTT